MRHRISLSIVFCLLGASFAGAQDAGYHIVHVEKSPLGKGTGAFASVCIDQAEGLIILQQRAGEWKWGSGVNQTISYSAETLPYFSTPILITSECLQKLTAQYEKYYGRNDLVVLDLK